MALVSFLLLLEDTEWRVSSWRESYESKNLFFCLSSQLSVTVFPLILEMIRKKANADLVGPELNLSPQKVLNFHCFSSLKRNDDARRPLACDFQDGPGSPGPDLGEPGTIGSVS